MYDFKDYPGGKHETHIWKSHGISGPRFFVCKWWEKTTSMFRLTLVASADRLISSELENHHFDPPVITNIVIEHGRL